LHLPESNERVEYLGDAVLELITTEYLFKTFPDYQEGKLTDIRSALVRGRNLADIALRLGLQDMVLLSRGETQA
jgi:ribonuclease-3